MIVAELKSAGLRVALDDRVEVSFGRRAVEWELKGVPVRVEIGPRDMLADQVTLVRRDNATKRSVPLASTVAEVTAALGAAQDALLAGAKQFCEARTLDVETVEDALDAGQTGFAVVPWSVVGPEGEARLAESAVTVRCLLHPDGRLAAADDEPGLLAVCGRAY